MTIVKVENVVGAEPRSFDKEEVERFLLSCAKTSGWDEYFRYFKIQHKLT